MSNIGFVDTRLHIQVKAVLDTVAWPEGYYIVIDFVNADKEVVYRETAKITFVTDRKYTIQELIEEEPIYIEYCELIYDDITNPEQLNDLSMTISYMKPAKVIEGAWEFSFAVPEKVTTEFHVDREFHINGEIVKIDMVSLSPLGVTVHLPIDMSAVYAHEDAVFVEYKDGTLIELAQSSIHTYNSDSTLIFAGEIIEIENVQCIVINGERINISQ